MANNYWEKLPPVEGDEDLPPSREETGEDKDDDEEDETWPPIEHPEPDESKDK